jgi:predicted nicotinamide N-methyase
MGVAAPVQGRFDLIMGSDILYERDEAGTLPAFIEEHAAHACEVWVVDPNRGNRAAFHKAMHNNGFALTQTDLLTPLQDETPYRGRFLSYQRD